MPSKPRVPEFSADAGCAAAGAGGLVGRYTRLLDELAAAHAESPSNRTRGGRIARLTEDLIDALRAASAGLSADEQTDECPRGFAW
jgi:hypothetical protein